MIGLDRNETKEFIATIDKDNAKPTIFLLGNITNAQKIKLIGNAMNKDGQVDNKIIQEKAIDIFKMGLKGIKNLYLASKKAPADVSEITDEVIDAVPLQVLYEVIAEIMKHNFEMGEVRKN